MANVIRKSGANPYQKLIADVGQPMVAKVGWLASSQYEDGTPAAYVAAINEFGSPKNSIPSRSFIRSTIATQRAAWLQVMAHGAQQVVQGKRSQKSVLEEVGLLAEGDMRKKLTSISAPPLSRVTLQLRKWKKDGIKITGKSVGWAASLVAKGLDDSSGVSTKPLNDSGYMLSTLISVVETK